MLSGKLFKSELFDHGVIFKRFSFQLHAIFNKEHMQFKYLAYFFHFGIYRWSNNGSHCIPDIIPNLKIQHKVADYFKVSLDFLSGRDETKNAPLKRSQMNCLMNMISFMPYPGELKI